SGALKHFFDTTYYAVREPTAGSPFSYWIHGGYDTTGAETAMKQITAGLGWTLAYDPLVFTGEVTDDHLARATDLTATDDASTLSALRSPPPARTHGTHPGFSLRNYFPIRKVVVIMESLSQSSPDRPAGPEQRIRHE